MAHRVETNDLLATMQLARVCLASSAGPYGRKSIDWEPFSVTFIVMDGDKKAYEGKILAHAVSAYNAAT